MPIRQYVICLPAIADDELDPLELRWLVRLIRQAASARFIESNPYMAAEEIEQAEAGLISKGYIARGQGSLTILDRWADMGSDTDRFEPPTTTIPHRTDEGFIYLIKSEMGHFKIGRTKSPETRLKQFLKLPFAIEVITVIKTSDMRSLEAELHAIYDPKRVNGEWFALDDDDVAYIKSLAGGAS